MYKIYILFALFMTGCVGLYPYQARRESRCENGDGDACYRVGWQVFHKTHKSSVDAFDWFKRGCALDDIDACSSAGRFAEEQKKPKATQLKFRGKACNLGHGYSCSIAGDLAESDAAQAAWFEKGCILDMSYSCHWVGTKTSTETPESQRKKTAYFEKSCKLSSGNCSSFAFALVKGVGIEKDVKRGT